MLVKVYGEPHRNQQERKYSPNECCGEIKTPTCGESDHAYAHAPVFSSTDGHSKTLVNHMHAVALNFMFYNFCKIHSTLRVTPAIKAGIDDHVWSMEEV